MLKRVVTVIGLLAWASSAAAEWTAVSGVPETSLLDVDVRGEDVLAASDSAVYRSPDAGKTWKRLLAVKGETRVTLARWSPLPGGIAIGTTKGLKFSSDEGKTWRWAHRPRGEAAAVNAAAFDETDAGIVWVATPAGIYRADTRTGTSVPVKEAGRSAFQALAAGQGRIVAAGDEAILGTSDGRSWKMLYSRTFSPGGTAAGQFAVEEAALPGYFTHAIVLPGGKTAVASRHGVYEAGGSSATLLDGQSFPSRRITALAASGETLFAASEKGIYRRHEGRFEPLENGLLSDDVRALSYDTAADALWAATGGGLFRHAHPASRPVTLSAETSRDVLAAFQSEPSVRSVQEAAIRYAEVEPEKIAAWRRAAAKKAWLPTLSVGSDFSQDQNIDLDRGGTADPDRFIQGPEEKSADLSVNLSWDLGEIVWNNDQTSIDTRSKLMAELRDDVLNDVTHVYFERRRLQAQMATSPSMRDGERIEKELKLQELTARLDGLTGGYFSSRANGGGLDGPRHAQGKADVH